MPFFYLLQISLIFKKPNQEVDVFQNAEILWYIIQENPIVKN